MQFAADNKNLKEETIDGKNITHAMVVYQRKVFGPELPPTIAGNHLERCHSLKRGGSVYELQECSGYGKTPKVTQYTGAVDKEWLKGEGVVLSEATNTDDTWALLHTKPAGLLKKSVEAQEEQPVPGWGGFNSILYPELPSASKIRSCPMIEGPSTVMKHAQRMRTQGRIQGGWIGWISNPHFSVKKIQNVTLFEIENKGRNKN